MHGPHPGKLNGRMPHPFPYQGSKRKIAQRIVNRMPSDIGCLYEAFAGSAAVSIAVAHLGRARSFSINDLHSPLTTLWLAILDDPDELCDRYEQLWLQQAGRDREFFDEVRAEFNRTHEPHHLLYLLARCVKAAIRYNSRGEFNNSPDKRRKGMRPDTMRKNIREVSALLQAGDGATVTNCDYADAVCDATPEDLVYMDPPYQGVTDTHNHRYLQGLEMEHFVETLTDLNRRGISYIVSYDGRTGDKVHGERLPSTLGLFHEEVAAGRSTQATLLGRAEDTFESLYLSPALVERLGGVEPHLDRSPEPSLF